MISRYDSRRVSPRMTRSTVSPDFGALVESLRLAVFVFDGPRVVYRNPAADSLTQRLLSEYQVDLLVMLRDHHLESTANADSSPPSVTLLTGARGEPLYVYLHPLPRDGESALVAVSIRELGVEREAFARRYGLSPREAEVAELVLKGYANPQIAVVLGIAQTTAKRHLTRIFDKLGVHSRSQLINRLA